MKNKIYFHPRIFSEQRLKSSIITNKVVRVDVLISINEKSVTFKTIRSEVKQSLIQELLEQIWLKKGTHWSTTRRPLIRPGQRNRRQPTYRHFGNGYPPRKRYAKN